MRTGEFRKGGKRHQNWNKDGIRRTAWQEGSPSSWGGRSQTVLLVYFKAKKSSSDLGWGCILHCVLCGGLYILKKSQRGNMGRRREKSQVEWRGSEVSLNRTGDDSSLVQVSGRRHGNIERGGMLRGKRAEFETASGHGRKEESWVTQETSHVSWSPLCV